MPTPSSEKTPLLSSPTGSSSSSKKKTVTLDKKAAASPNNNNNNNNTSSPSKKKKSSSKTSSSTRAALIKAASTKINLNNVHHKREVNYSGDGHFTVLFQMYGSVWPKVFPWCVLISALSATIFYLREHNIVDLTIQSNSGHGFISILVSFLIVTRTTITYNRFMEARQHLEDLFRSSRELVQYACAYTIVDKGPQARAWRQRLAYRTIITLRMAVAAIEYRGHGINAWETLHEEEHDLTPLILPKEEEDDDNENENDKAAAAKQQQQQQQEEEQKKKKKVAKKKESQQQQQRRQRESIQRYKPSQMDHSYFLRDLSHGPRTLTDENMRAPIVWVYNLRETIVEIRHDKNILPVHPCHVNEVLKLNAFASDINTSFHGLKKLITTPFPFPLVQMTRTFLFFWMFSLPSVLVPSYEYVWEIVILMFFVTYGFLGLEYVNMELDDPHGQDPNDFPGHRWAQQVFEDIYITIYKMDGIESAFQLRTLISERVTMGNALENCQTTSSTTTTTTQAQ